MEQKRVKRMPSNVSRSCEGRIRMPAPGTRSHKLRVFQAEMNGRRPEECARPAVYIVDHKFMCSECAAYAALKIALE